MIKAIIFDAFGTLFNLDRSMLDNLDNPKIPEILAYAREKQLSYTWLRSLMKDYIPFDEITKIALKDGCKKYDTNQSLVEQLMPLYFEPTTFDDVAPTLSSLHKTNKVIGILSNGTHEMLQSGIRKNSLNSYLNKIYSADDIKVFKPDPKVYAMVTDSLQLKPNEILFASSNQWDVAGAANFGFNVKWVNRSKAFRESVTKGANIQEVKSLSELAGV